MQQSIFLFVCFNFWHISIEIEHSHDLSQHVVTFIVVLQFFLAEYSQFSIYAQLCVSHECRKVTSCISTLLTRDFYFLPAKFCWNFTNWTMPLVLDSKTDSWLFSHYVRGIVHPKSEDWLKVYLHPQCVWLSSFRRIQSKLYTNNILALLGFIMDSNGGRNFEAQNHHIK